MLVDFGGLFGRYSQDVFLFALFLSGNLALAEDICQETFVRAWATSVAQCLCSLCLRSFAFSSTFRPFP
jgi:Sigma-70 region 2